MTGSIKLARRSGAVSGSRGAFRSVIGAGMEEDDVWPFWERGGHIGSDLANVYTIVAFVVVLG